MMVTIENHSWDSYWWTMTFDLKEICENMGKKERDNNGKLYTVIKVPQVRKILKLIRSYKDDVDDVTEFLKDYPKVYDLWNKVSGDQ